MKNGIIIGVIALLIIIGICYLEAKTDNRYSKVNREAKQNSKDRVIDSLNAVLKGLKSVTPVVSTKSRYFLVSYFKGDGSLHFSIGNFLYSADGFLPYDSLKDRADHFAGRKQKGEVIILSVSELDSIDYQKLNH